MKKRLISAFIGTIILFAVLLSNEMAVDIAITLVTFIAVKEVLSAFGLLRLKFPALLCFLVPLMPWIYHCAPYKCFEGIVILYLLCMLSCLTFMHGRISFRDIAVMIFATAILTILFLYIAEVRHLEQGEIYIWMIFIGAWISDSCAYFCGRAFGSHPLAPEISPKKTVEGAVGGILGTAVSFMVFGAMMRNMFGVENVNYFIFFALGILCSVFGQLGDLTASAIKRECGIKDFGKIMPGHGGILDRFDSGLFVAPLIYYFLIFLG